MNRWSRVLSVFLLSALMSGCATIAVQRDYDESASFDAYQSFSWIPAKNTQDVPGPYQDDGLLDKRIRQAVARSLVAQGYTEQNSNTPDFYVVYRVGLEEKTRYFDSGYYGYAGYSYGFYGYPYRYRRPFFGYRGFGLGYGYPYSGGGPGSYGTVTAYTEGTLVIDVIDAKTDALVWRGSAVSPLSNEAYDAKDINKAVEKILEEFPPQRYPSKSPESRRQVVAS